MAEKSKRGFASMDHDKQRQIASKGGKAAHQKGTAHEFNSEEARKAGRKGGLAAHQRGNAHEFTPEEARSAGRKGGHASHKRFPDSINVEPDSMNVEVDKSIENPTVGTGDMQNQPLQESAT